MSDPEDKYLGIGCMFIAIAIAIILASPAIVWIVNSAK